MSGRLGTFPRLLRAARPAAVEAAALVAVARVLVRHVPMRHWHRLLNAGPENGGGDAEGRRALGREVGGIVRTVAFHLPFRAACLPQAMAAQWMLRRRGVSSRLTFGVRRAPGSPQGAAGKHAGAPAAGPAAPSPPRLHFHAWLTVAGEPVVGGWDIETYAPLPEVPPRPAGPLTRGSRAAPGGRRRSAAPTPPRR